jgi:hypothetical protein
LIHEEVAQPQVLSYITTSTAVGSYIYSHIYIFILMSDTSHAIYSLLVFLTMITTTYISTDMPGHIVVFFKPLDLAYTMEICRYCALSPGEKTTGPRVQAVLMIDKTQQQAPVPEGR